MKEELRKKVQQVIIKSENAQKKMEAKMVADYANIAVYLKRYTRLEAVEGLGELLKEWDVKLSSKWFGLGSVVVNKAAEAYLSYVTKKVKFEA